MANKYDELQTEHKISHNDGLLSPRKKTHTTLLLPLHFHLHQKAASFLTTPPILPYIKSHGRPSLSQSIHSLTKKTKRAAAEMAFSKSKFLTIFLLFCSLLHLGFANEEVVDNPIAQSEIGQRLPYAQDSCNYCHPGTCCGGGDYCNPPCQQNGCGCVENPGSRCCSGSICHPSCPSCQCQGPCPSCSCVRSNVKVEGQHESNSDHPSSESKPPKH